jgi:hypothetical protein
MANRKKWKVGDVIHTADVRNVVMTKEEFDDACALLQEKGLAAISDKNDARVCIAAGYIIKHRRGISDEVMWQPTDADLAEFFPGLNRAQRKKLKHIADSLIDAGVEAMH